MKNKGKIISWTLVVLWMIFIFAMSSMSGHASDTGSKGIIEEVITGVVKVTNKNLSELEISKMVEDLNHPFRKCMHMFEYFVLAILILNALKYSKMPKWKRYFITIVWCFLYACTDEFHQLFVDGRGAQFTDSLIDTTGSFIGCLLVFIINIICKKMIKKEEKC